MTTTDFEKKRSWWRTLNRYQWSVFVLAAFGWLFDCFDQQIFTMSRSITMRDLLPAESAASQTQYGTWATSIFILGWATGGLIFGKLGDRWGRAKTMALTIMVYAACTGLSGFAKSWGVFAAFRFVTGAGVGGEFAVGAALVAEVMSDYARPSALGALQALSALGNILAAISLGVVVPSEKLGWGWRGLYYLGALPALVAVIVFWRLREPKKWVEAKAEAERTNQAESMGRIRDLFRNRVWRRNTFVGLGLAVAGQIGLWGIGFYSPELIDSAIPAIEPALRPGLEQLIQNPDKEGRRVYLRELSANQRKKLLDLAHRAGGEKNTEQNVEAFLEDSTHREQMSMVLGRAITEDQKTYLKSIGGILQQLGAFTGIACFTALTARIGRRSAFLLALLLAWGSLVLTFSVFHEPKQIWYLWPILGFCTFAPFGGYAIYFPELFPTRLRTTGTSFCYNVGRYVTAFGVSILGPLALALQGVSVLPGFRLAAILLSSCYLIGLVALIWAPETVNQPLPEERPVAH